MINTDSNSKETKIPMATSPQTEVDISKKAVELVKNEKVTWETGTAFITERVAFQMRNLIRVLRKNFWGVFDIEKDQATGRKKIWIPLTESFVDSVVKNIDLDTKDISFRAKHDGAIGMTQVIRSVVRNVLDKIGFGEYLDDFEKRLAIDGTAVWKTLTKTDPEDNKQCVDIVPVDLLNIYIDPTARSIQDAYRFTERSLMVAEDVKAMTGWMNTDEVVGTTGLAPTDAGFGSPQFSTTKAVDVWESWGKFPKSLMTGKAEDDKVETDLHIVCSGLETVGKERVHLIETFNGIKPYEEAWYSRVPGRWYGRGVAEKLMMLQLWVNTVVNIRINRATISQLGIFKIRKGSGLNAQMFSKIASNGAIVVNNMDDLQQFVMQEASGSSYKDEDVIMNWARQNTSNWEAVTGESMPSSTPATNAALSSRASASQFTLVKEQLGMFLQRWVKRQLMPKITSYMTKDELVRMGLDPEALQAWDEQVVHASLTEQIEKHNQAGLFVNEAQVERERQKALAQLQNMGKERFTKLLEDLEILDYDVQVFVTNEEMDIGVMTDKLNTQLQMIPALAQTGLDVGTLATEIVRQSWDIMGLDASKVKIKPQQAPQAGGMNPQSIMNQTTPPAGATPASPVPTPGMMAMTEQMAAGNTMEPSYGK